MDGQLLRQADFLLSKCGRPTPPQEGVSVVYLPKAFMLQAVAPVASSQVWTKEITGDTTFCLRAISSTIAGALSLDLQIQLPNGRFLINTLQPITEMGGYGSYRYLLSKELACPPGSKLQITLDTTLLGAVTAQPIVLLFEGAYAYYLRCDSRGAVGVEELASQLPRYLASPGQNIMAPCWASGEGPRTPDGFRDDRFIYSSSVVSIALAGPALSGSTSIQLRQNADFECRRLLLDVVPAATVTAGVVLAKVRLASGYQLTDDFIDLAQYLGSVHWAHDWHISRGDAVVFDFLLVDGAGTGSVAVQVHLDGVARRKVAA